MNEEPRLGRSVSINHAATLLGVSRRTVYNYIKAGWLRTVTTLGHRSQRVTVESLFDAGFKPQQPAGASATMMRPKGRC